MQHSDQCSLKIYAHYCVCKQCVLHVNELNHLICSLIPTVNHTDTLISILNPLISHPQRDYTVCIAFI